MLVTEPLLLSSPFCRRLNSVFRILSLSLLILPTQSHAQALAAGNLVTSGTASTNDAGPSGLIPFTHGLNASLGTSSQHDSSSGWSTILTPGLAYRFNSLLSLSASIPIYAYINVEANTGTKAKPVYVLKTKHEVPGDASIAAHLDLHPSFDYDATISLGLPSGNPAFGLGAGQPTYDINNHFEKNFGIFSPDIEFGIGDSTSLVRPRVRKNYTAVGNLAHFQVGSSIDLPLNMSFEVEGYEVLPYNPATIYSTTGKGKKKVTTATTVGNAEDNGISNSLDIPINGHITLSGFYDRSIRNSDDVAGFSLTFLLKAPPRPEDVPR